VKTDVEKKFQSYPQHVRTKMDQLRALILSTAEEIQTDDVQESLKWGEPTYTVKSGSPIRIDWKENSPDNYYMFFNCQTILVETFRELYSKELQFDGKRAIVLSLADDIPVQAIKHCAELALNYKNIKSLPLLGA